MSAPVNFSDNNDSNTQFRSNTKAEAARCAISEDGEIIYASDSFYDLVNIPSENRDKSLSIFDIFIFAERGINEYPSLRDFNTGIHTILLNTDRSVIKFQFDWLTTPGQTRYLIASQVDKSRKTITEDDADRILTSISRTYSPLTGDEKDTDFLIHDPAEMESLSRLSLEIMMIADKNGNLLRANKNFFDRIGYRPDEIHHLNFLDLFSTEEKPNARTHLVQIKRAIEKQITENCNFESSVITKDGEKIWVNWSQKNDKDRIYISGNDITEFVRKNEDLLNRQKQLSEAESIGRMGHWQWIVGENDISWSEEIFRMFGVDPNHFQPTIKRIDRMVHRRDLARVIQAFQRAMIEKQNYEMEFRVTRPGGEVRHIQCEGRCEKNEDNEVIALYGILQDITERTLHEQELHAAKDASEQAYAAKTRFLANMSHELRTPLNAIIGFSEMIEHQLLGPVGQIKYKEYATGIRESGEHLLDLISDILDMSKIEAGKYTLDLSEVNINDIMTAAAKMVKGRANENNINLDIENACEEGMKLIADARAVKQIILNVLTNAVKFTKTNGSIWAECYRREEHLIIKICDTGIGIPANKLAAVMRPFEQASSYYTKDYEGTGLGLAITKELIELHGGNMHIDSKVGIGTTVTLRLPFDASKHFNVSEQTEESNSGF